MNYTISILSKRIVNFLLNIFIARIVSVQDFGEYSQFIILCTYLLLITEFGYNEYILVKSKKNNNLDFLLPSFTIISTITFVLISIVSFIYNQSLLLFLVLIKVYMDTYLTKLLFTYFQFKQDFKTVSYINYLYCLLVAILIVYLQFAELTIINILLTLDIFIFVTIILFLLKSDIKFNKFDIKKMIPLINKDFFYFGFSSITIPMYMQLPLFMMTFFVDNSDIGIFYLAYTISSVMLLVSISINQQYLPKIIHNVSNEKFFNIIKFPIALLILFNLIMFIFFIFFGHDLISTILNKPEYIESNKYILYLIISNCFQSISGLLALYLISKGLMKQKLYIHIELIFVALVSSLTFINLYSLNGVIISYIIIYTYSIYKYLFETKKISHA